MWNKMTDGQGLEALTSDENRAQFLFSFPLCVFVPVAFKFKKSTANGLWHCAPSPPTPIADATREQFRAFIGSATITTTEIATSPFPQQPPPASMNNASSPLSPAKDTRTAAPTLPLPRAQPSSSRPLRVMHSHRTAPRASSPVVCGSGCSITQALEVGCTTGTFSCAAGSPCGCRCGFFERVHAAPQLTPTLCCRSVCSLDATR